MTWSGVGRSERPAADGAADDGPAVDGPAVDALADDPVAGASPPELHAVSTARARATVAADTRALTPASVLSATAGRTDGRSGVLPV
jgi:hypothetical protein